jgi:hypothetical protein
MSLKILTVASAACATVCLAAITTARTDEATDECSKLEPLPPELAWCRGYLKLKKQKEDAKRKEAPDVTDRIFLRSDRLDNRYQAFSGNGTAAINGGGGAKGASFSYTDNRLQQTQTGAISPTQNITVTGIASLSLGLVEPIDSPWSFAPVAWVFDNGTYDRPKKVFGEDSALMTGVDLMFQHSAAFLGTNTQYLIVSPYHQTDMYFDGRAEGISLSAEVERADWYLGAVGMPNNGYLNGYVALRPEVTFLSVGNPGETNLMRRDYEWFGGTARGYLYLFPSCPKNSVFSCTTSVPPWLRDRISLIGTALYFWDPQISRNVRYYTAEVQYNITGDKTDGTPIDGDKLAGRRPTAAISFEYDYGVDRDMLVNINRYLIKLNLKY